MGRGSKSTVANNGTETSSRSGTPLEKFSKEDLAQHNKLNDAWMVIDNKVYDVTNFIGAHPGGPVLMTFAGMDATDVFNAMHPAWANNYSKPYLIGELDKNEPTAVERDMRKLRQEFVEEGLFQKNTFRHYFFYFKLIAAAFVMWAASVWLIAFNKSLPLNLLGCVVLAVFWQQNGWLSHDFLHYQVFESRLANWIIPWFLGAIGSGYSYIWWSKKHNTHHAVTNVLSEDAGPTDEHSGDPDIHTMPFLAFCERAIDAVGPLGAFSRFWLRHQHIAFIPLLAFARISWNIQASLTVLEGMDVWVAWRARWKWIEFVASLSYWSWSLGIFFATMSPGRALALYLFAQGLSGVILAGSFVLNHTGLDILPPKEQDKMDFFTLQAITGRDITPGAFNNWFTGGLNLQIEHHLFPRMPRHNYPLIYDRVRKLCQKHNIKHHSVGFWTGFMECYRHMKKVGSHVDAKKAK